MKPWSVASRSAKNRTTSSGWARAKAETLRTTNPARPRFTSSPASGSRFVLHSSGFASLGIIFYFLAQQQQQQQSSYLQPVVVAERAALHVEVLEGDVEHERAVGHDDPAAVDAVRVLGRVVGVGEA